MSQTIAPETTIGEIQLFVSDLKRSLAFYQERLGFRPTGSQTRAGEASLGTGSQRLLTLVEKPQAKAVQGTTGLYHLAIRLPDRRSLALLIYHLAESGTEVQGVADHGVSEAVYLADPDGNGIELYCDRKRSEWPFDDLGKLQMGTDDLDLDDLLLELREGVRPWNELPEGTVIGHVHLKVRDLLEAERFYTQVLGFQLMQRYESGAIFVSAGGYHHHIGMNVWASKDAPPPPSDATGLKWVEVRLPNATALEALQTRLQSANVPAEPQNDGLLVKDPSQNGLLFRA